MMIENNPENFSKFNESFIEKSNPSWISELLDYDKLSKLKEKYKKQTNNFVK